MSFHDIIKCGMRFVIILFCIIMSLVTVPVGAISKEQEAAIVDHCTAIKDDLREVQRADARARVYIGGKYETILGKYVVPLNLYLVEKNLSRADLIESQNSISETRTAFSNDYVDYQQGLEQLVAMDCKTEPERFYDKLVRVRQKRKKVEQDMTKMGESLAKYKERVLKLKEHSDGKAE